MKSADIRKAVFAGSWYPARASECENEIKAFLKEGEIFCDEFPGLIIHSLRFNIS